MTSQWGYRACNIKIIFLDWKWNVEVQILSMERFNDLILNNLTFSLKISFWALVNSKIIKGKLINKLIKKFNITII